MNISFSPSPVLCRALIQDSGGDVPPFFQKCRSPRPREEASPLFSLFSVPFFFPSPPPLDDCGAFVSNFRWDAPFSTRPPNRRRRPPFAIFFFTCMPFRRIRSQSLAFFLHRPFSLESFTGPSFFSLYSVGAGCVWFLDFLITPSAAPVFNGPVLSVWLSLFSGFFYGFANSTPPSLLFFSVVLRELWIFSFLLKVLIYG